MKIYIGSDHGGFNLKESVKKYLAKQSIDFQDLGNKVFDKDDDYPDFSYKVAKAVVSKPGSLGILFCGSSAGACIVANKVRGIRAASARSVGEAQLAREHNDVNIICLAGGEQVQKSVKGLVISKPLAQKIIKVWLKAKFSNAKRHRRRINKIKKIESKK